jgi:hypothetical protein
MKRNGLAEHLQDDDVVQISTTGATSCFHAASHAASGAWILTCSLPHRDVMAGESHDVDFVFLDFFSI